MASPTQWTWVWVNSRSWWQTGRPGLLRFMGSQRVGNDWGTELNRYPLEGFLGGASGKEPACQCRRQKRFGSIPGLGKSSGWGHGNPLQYFLPGESPGQRSLAGYSPWGHKEPYMTERLRFNDNIYNFIFQPLSSLNVSYFAFRRLLNHTL